MYDVSIFHSSCFHTVHVLILLHDVRYFLPVVPVCFVMKSSWGGACSRTASATNAQTGTKTKWRWEWESHVDSESGQTLPEKKKKKCWIRFILSNTIDARKTAKTSGTSCMKSLVCRIPDHEKKNIYIYARRPADVHHRLEGSSHHSPSPLYFLFLFFYGMHAYYAMLTSTTWSLANLSQGMTNASIKPRSQSYVSKISSIFMAHILSSTWGIFNVTHWKTIEQEIACTASILMTFHNRWHVSSELSYIVWCGPLFST